MLVKMDESLNVFGDKLEVCGERPLTGFFRDSQCNTCKEDTGSHTVCIEATAEFLDYSRAKGNNLSSPVPEFNFEGLRPGNCWCLCAARWLEAYEDNSAPRVFLRKTHLRALEIIPLEYLKKYAVDLN